jgi:very-short-patch-repair endonuclease
MKSTNYNLDRRYKQFIEDAKKVHGDLYDYSFVEYMNTKTPVTIVCNVHGKFKQSPKVHRKGMGCKECATDKRRITTDQFISRSNKTHDGYYLYGDIIVTAVTDMVQITCPEHGAFTQQAGRHMVGRKCTECAKKLRTLTREQFVERSEQTHGELYEYSLVEYTNIHTKVQVVCTTHGPYLVSPALHIQRTGCPSCTSSKGQLAVRLFLKKHEISFLEEYRFPDCRNKYPLPYDFFLPDRRVVIEYDGIQHYKPVPIFGGDSYLEQLQENDKIKNTYASEQGIQLIRIPYTKLYDVDDILRELLLVSTK